MVAREACFSEKGAIVQAIVNDDDPRSDPRCGLFLMAVLRAGASVSPVRVHNLSAQGALLEGGCLPGEGAAVRLRRGSLEAAGEVAWARAPLCGVRFDTPIDADEWIGRAGPAWQQRIDAAVAEFRTYGPGAVHQRTRGAGETPTGSRRRE